MTDEELKAYADKHWKNVVLCSECKHLQLKVFKPCVRYNWCKMLMVPVDDDFWCKYGEKK